MRKNSKTFFFFFSLTELSLCPVMGMLMSHRVTPADFQEDNLQPAEGRANNNVWPRAICRK